MGLVTVVTSLTPDMVEVTDGDTITIRIDQARVFLDGATRAEQLRVLSTIAHKLLNAHDAIAAQERLFDAEVDRDRCPTCGSPDPMILGTRCLDRAQLIGGRSLVNAFHPEGAQA